MTVSWDWCLLVWPHLCEVVWTWVCGRGRHTGRDAVYCGPCGLAERLESSVDRSPQPCVGCVGVAG